MIGGKGANTSRSKRPVHGHGLFRVVSSRSGRRALTFIVLGVLIIYGIIATVSPVENRATYPGDPSYPSYPGMNDPPAGPDTTLGTVADRDTDTENGSSIPAGQHHRGADMFLKRRRDERSVAAAWVEENGSGRAGTTAPIEGDVTWSADRVVNTTVEVKPSGSLTIAPGVSVQFEEGIGLDVKGRLIVAGTFAAPVELTGNLSQNAYWRGINLINTNAKGNRVENATIGFATNGIIATNASLFMNDTIVKYCGTGAQVGVGVRIEDRSNATLRNCSLRYNYDGVRVDDASILLDRTTIVHSHDTAVTAARHRAFAVRSCNISENGAGIVIEEATATAEVVASTIVGNARNGINASAPLVIERSLVAGSGQWGIRVVEAALTIRNISYIENNRTNARGDLAVLRSFSVNVSSGHTGEALDEAEVSVVNPTLGALRGKSGDAFVVTLYNITTNYNLSTAQWETQRTNFSYSVIATYQDMVNWTRLSPRPGQTLDIQLFAPQAQEAGFTVKFAIGLVALILFFAVIILSLLGIIPQDRLPIQPALVVMTFIIVGLVFIAHLADPSIELVSPFDLEGQVIIHPITALAAGFMVAGALEAAGAFEAAADALNKLEKVKILGITGTVTILINLPTIIAMPCGRILAAALMPAALYFGYRVARNLDDPRMVGVIVFAFIVNAAASCGPSPLGGIGTIGEGMTRLPIGSYNDAQQVGIMFATGVCALVMKFVTPLLPADLKEDEERRKEEEERIERHAAAARKPSAPDRGPKERTEAEAPTEAEARDVSVPTITSDMDETERAVVKALAKNPKATLKEVAAETGLRIDEIKDHYVARKRAILKGGKNGAAKSGSKVGEKKKKKKKEEEKGDGKEEAPAAKDDRDPDAVLADEIARLLEENPKLRLKEAAEAVGKDTSEITKVYVEEKRRAMGKEKKNEGGS